MIHKCFWQCCWVLGKSGGCALTSAHLLRPSERQEVILKEQGFQQEQGTDAAGLEATWEGLCVFQYSCLKKKIKLSMNSYWPAQPRQLWKTSNTLVGTLHDRILLWYNHTSFIVFWRSQNTPVTLLREPHQSLILKGRGCTGLDISRVTKSMEHMLFEGYLVTTLKRPWSSVRTRTGWAQRNFSLAREKKKKTYTLTMVNSIITSQSKIHITFIVIALWACWAVYHFSVRHW